MGKSLFNQETGKFALNDDSGTQKNAVVNARSSQPRLEVGGQSKQLSNKSFAIGRDKSNQIIIADTKVSRFHAMVVFENEEAYIKDTDSTNGTFLNEKQLEPGKRYKLNDKDKIKVGTTVLTYYR